MKSDEFALGDAQVRHWDLNQLDEAVTLGEQHDSLKEDLAWIELGRGVSVDVGWYRTTFVIFVIVDGDWESPVQRLQAATLKALIRELHRAIAFARKL